MSEALCNEFMRFVQEKFPKWRPSMISLEKLSNLDIKSINALKNALITELESSSSFNKRENQITDFYQFDINLNSLFSEILISILSIEPITSQMSSELFIRDYDIEKEEQDDLKAKGYKISSHKLNNDQLINIRKEVANCQFINRGIFDVEMSGTDIFTKIEKGSIEQLSGKNGDTFWLKDLNQLCQKEYFQRLAFDPYILSTVAQYLGCCPIHVQTNLWFSFPTFEEKNNLSSNAQLFHQDKEFTKFIKVFIYLNDVDENNGPHCYIEGSHIDEAHTYGVSFSHRVPDNDITQYYKSERIKTLTASAGSITFGDTSCVHKGQSVKGGYRVMLQLEYASSLYLSPVCPFSNLSKEALDKIDYPIEIVSRLTKNYNDDNRQSFIAYEKAILQPKSNKVIKLMRLTKRYIKSFVDHLTH